MKETMRISTIILMVLGVFALSGCNLNGGGSGGTTYAIGDIGPSGVGIVFYVTDDGLHGLEVAPVDQNNGNKIVWSNEWDKEIGTTGTDIGTGSANTDAIIAQSGHSISAAEKCREYRAAEEGDWFLPSKDELNKIHVNLHQQGIGGFDSTSYWSSSEVDSDFAWSQYFGTGGNQDDDDKALNLLVRAVRAF